MLDEGALIDQVKEGIPGDEVVLFPVFLSRPWSARCIWRAMRTGAEEGGREYYGKR